MKRIILLALIAGAAGMASGQTLEELQQYDREREQAPKWVPPDSDPIGEYNFGDARVNVYQFRMEFFIAASSAPLKTIQFKHHIHVNPHPALLKEAGRNLLVCTNRLAGYSGRNEKENRMIHFRGFQSGPMPWENPKGTVDDFCGILSTAGETIFEYPKETQPSVVYHPVAIVNDGKRAGVLVGEILQTAEEESEDAQDGPQMGRFREIWIWEAPSKMRKVPITKKDLFGRNLLDGLRSGKL